MRRRDRGRHAADCPPRPDPLESSGRRYARPHRPGRMHPMPPANRNARLRGSADHGRGQRGAPRLGRLGARRPGRGLQPVDPGARGRRRAAGAHGQGDQPRSAAQTSRTRPLSDRHPLRPPHRDRPPDARRLARWLLPAGLQPVGRPLARALPPVRLLGRPPGRGCQRGPRVRHRPVGGARHRRTRRADRREAPLRLRARRALRDHRPDDRGSRRGAGRRDRARRHAAAEHGLARVAALARPRHASGHAGVGRAEPGRDAGARPRRRPGDGGVAVGTAASAPWPPTRTRWRHCT